ncbi:hypothetical protein [Sphingomonas sp. VNH70]|uniref:hypothetical protein n=1 Tax=Sphingomonas silueang TaxID=3156617 RepID=UPI0032B4698B
MPSSLSPDHVAALAAVARMLAEAQGPWWVIAGAAVALHGAPVEVDDIDILFSASDTALVSSLPAMCRNYGAGTTLFRSGFYAASTIGTVRVEWMADFEVSIGTGWHPVLPRSREPAHIGEATVFVPDRGELIAMLASFGRPKDHDRIALLTM